MLPRSATVLARRSTGAEYQTRTLKTVCGRVDREEQKRKIAEWKAAKEQEQREAEGEERKREREAKAREAERKKEEAERVKRRVRNYQESKQLEKEAKSYREQMEKEVDKPKVSAEQLQRIQERNEMLVRNPRPMGRRIRERNQVSWSLI